MLERLLPPPVVVVESRGEIDDAALFPEEAEVVAGAVERRQLEFATGRACARAALGRLGFEPGPIPSGPRGAPQWPAGIVGSITHCDGFRACALARSEEVVSLGVDAEVHAALPPGLLADIALPEERGRLEALRRAEPQVHWDRLLFSAKESVYKAWFPLTERWLGFEDASLTIDPRRAGFSARLLVPGPALDGRALTGFSGGWSVGEGLIATAIAVPVSAPQPH